MDGLELSKIVGAGCVAMLAYVGGSELTHALFAPGHLYEPAYSVEVADTSAGEEEVEVTPLPVILASVDAAEGEKVFKKCAACHGVEAGGPNKVGPNLHGIMGRQIASVDGFSYSNALAELDLPWDWDTMNGFLADPKGWAPGTKMGFAGLRKEEDRAEVMLWLNQQSDAPLALPE